MDNRLARWFALPYAGFPIQCTRTAMRYDVLGIGNAIIDVIAPVDDGFLSEELIEKSSMSLIDEKRAVLLHKALKNRSTNLTEIAGGSGANTIAGVAGLGLRSAYIGRVASDDLGEKFRTSMSEAGVDPYTPRAKAQPATARCLIAVTPDAERSMSTFLGANIEFSPKDIDLSLIQQSATTYLEGYLFDTDQQKQAFAQVGKAAKNANTQVALTLSDAFCVDRHREDFRQFINKYVDVLFANQDELLSLYETTSFEHAIAQIAKKDISAAVTRSGLGSVIVSGGEVFEVNPVSVNSVIDTTGAGDQYAAGVLAGRAMGMSWPDAGFLGSICASEVISHFGARPEVNIHSQIVGTGLQ